MFRVIMRFGGKPVRKYTFDKPLVAIGRDETCDITLENIGASRRHATIEKTDDGYVLADLKSHNGTFIDGRKVEEHTLQEADEFVIGKYAFQFELLDPVVELEDAPKSHVEGGGGSADSTFRLERDQIESMINKSTRGSSSQLVQIAPVGDKKSMVLDKGYYVIGSCPSAEIKLSGLFAPSKAAIIIKGDHGYRVLGLARRFKLNGKKAPDRPLKDGDLLQCGGARFRFCQT